MTKLKTQKPGHWLEKKRPRPLFLQVYTDQSERGPRRFYGVFNSRAREVARFIYREEAVEYKRAKERS